MTVPDPRQVLAGSNRNPAPGAKLLGRTDAAAPVLVTVVLKRKNPIEDDTVQSHTSLLPGDRPTADHAAFAARFGASDDAVDSVRAFAAAHGLTVVDVDQGRRVVELSGSAADMELAFGTELNDYATATGTFRGRLGPLLLTDDIHPYVEAVLGLDNRPVAKPRFLTRAVQTSYYPPQIAELYDFPAGDGTGQTIALIELGGNFGPADLQTYFRNAGIAKAPTVTSVSVSSGVPVAYGSDPNSDGEVMLDIEVAGSLAPGATIAVYFAENTDQGFYQAVSQAVHDPATTVIGISWGSAEKDWSSQTMDAWNSLGQAAALLNVPIFVAAGDHGCTDEVPGDAGYDGERHVDFPGSCANGVVSCGGTNLVGAGAAISSETVWSESSGNGWATGGGVSTYFPIPSWQGVISAEATPLTMRGVPDVAGVADSATGINVIVNGTAGVSGGTSAVAPLWAALTAVLSQQLGKKAGFFIPLLYAHVGNGATNDIVAGNNTVFDVQGFSAKQGWDACTGLGSPKGAAVLAILQGAPIDGTIATTPPQPPSDGSGAGQLPAPPAPSTPAARTSQPFNAAAAVLYGRFVEASYAMYDAAPTLLTPAPSGIPDGYDLAAWVQMQDFLLGSTGPTFYGILAQSTSDPTTFVLAIRGTSSGIEWWDDANAIVKTPFKVAGCGSVGSGFARIYDTLEVVERPTGIAGASDAVRSLRSVGGFSSQIANLVSRHAAARARLTGVPTTANVAVTGHSLGAALATLYVMENAKTDGIANPLSCTFASPRVGDSTFVAAFNQLGLTSWRVVNVRDVVPGLPFQWLGFSHVDVEQDFDSSGKVQPNVGCWHSLATYLSLIDPTLSPDSNCRLGAPSLSPTRTDAAPSSGKTISVPAGPVRIDITVNLGAGSSG